MSKKKSEKVVEVEQTIKVDVMSVLINAIEEYGAKTILKMIQTYCLLNYIHYTTTTAITLADSKDIENSNTGTILFYLNGNWNELLNKASPYLAAKMSLAEKAVREEETLTLSKRENDFESWRSIL